MLSYYCTKVYEQPPHWGLYCLLGVMFTHYRASDQLNIHPTVHVNHTATIHVKHLVYTIDLVYKFEWNDSNRLITMTFFCLSIPRQARKLEPCQSIYWTA